MAKDISEELYAKIKESFDAKYEKAQLLGEPLHDVLARIRNGGGTFRDADLYSVEVGSMISDSLKENLILDEMPNKTFYRNIAKKTLGESLKDGYGMVSNIAAVVQEEMNASIGIGLKVVKPKLDVQAVDKIVNNAAQAETQDELDAVLTEPVKTFTRRVVDDTQKANARLHNRAGLEVKVEREYDEVGLHNGTDVCDFCIKRADTWTYEKAIANGVFERHEGCGCIITYTSKKGEVTRSTGKYGWKKQTMHTSPKEESKLGRLIEKNERIIKARRAPVNEGPYKTFDLRGNEKNDVIKPRNIDKNLLKTDIGLETKQTIIKNKIDVHLLYGFDNHDSKGNELLGYYEPRDNIIIIFADKTMTVQKTAEIIVHEAAHVNDYGYCQKSEVNCMAKELMHRYNRTELTYKEVKSIIKKTKDLYPELSWK